MYDFGVFIEVAPDVKEKQVLEQNIQDFKLERVGLEDAIAIRSVVNTKLANQMLFLERKKYQEELIRAS